MSTHIRPPPPGEEDLQHLYDEVWRIFDGETASPTERSPTSAVSAHAHEPYPNGSFHDVGATISPSSSIRSALPRPPMPAPQRPHSRKIRPLPDSATSPTPWRLRPLPLPPDFRFFKHNDNRETHQPRIASFSVRSAE
ncbi:uncharacterized protein EDB91DRAFT_48654 [Suillus paluster]|uniref:uncharacterized protein n=1 Tax=Suillus paluster TaxID=48578 RepID=UPI001B86A48F|nr:uncharacterized protein EDB91DRAFT_48654 [Suillus paluster]KAG1747872.1 hypothetical protein EDB91DRAFT_48654 [Suillus paluster]